MLLTSYLILNKYERALQSLLSPFSILILKDPISSPTHNLPLCLSNPHDVDARGAAERERDEVSGEGRRCVDGQERSSRWDDPR